MTEDTPAETFILKRKSTLIWSAIGLGWLFDFLFWQKVPGISIAIYLLVLTAVGFLLASIEDLKPARSVYLLLIPLGFFSIMTVVRVEPFTTFLNVAISLTLMGTIVHSFLGGKWWQYRFKDFLGGAFGVGLDALYRQIAVFASQPKPEEAEKESARQQGTRKTLSVLRGLLIALPIVLIFAAMLAEADPIFGDAFDQFVEIFNIDNLGEYIFRAILIGVLAYLILGVYLHAYYKNHDETLSPEEKRLLPRFLGITEASIVLGSVNLLFLVFVGIQFRYFFGGDSNINLSGYTYAEYARRGFSELVTVAVFSLILFLGLSFITKKEERQSQRLFSILGVVLFALVSVILVSSFQRLLLYEDAYGFTRLRTYTHVFIIWLGALLLAVSMLELFKRQRYFALAALIAGVGFAVSLNVLNVDGFIVRQNIARMANGSSFGSDGTGDRYSTGSLVDVGYLATLSEDAVPVLSKLYLKADSVLERQVIAGAIACHAEMNDGYDYEESGYQDYTWQSFHLARFRAQQDWQARSESPEAGNFTVYFDDGAENEPGWWAGYVIIGEEEVSCGTTYYWD